MTEQLSPLTELGQEFTLEKIDHQIEVEDRTLSFLFKQMETLRADRHLLLQIKKSLLKEKNGN